MNIFFRQAVRKPIFTVLTVLLLGFSVALSCIGYSAWISAELQRDEIASNYTTIAIPLEPELSGLSAEEIGIALQNRLYADFAAREAPQITKIDRRCLLSAHIAGSKSLSSSRVDPSEYNIAFDGECYSLAVFALRCESVRELSAEGQLLYDASFGVEEIVCLSDAYDAFPKPDSVYIHSDVREADGATPFEAGKTYLVFGQYQDYPIIRSADGYRQSTNGYRYIVPFPELEGNCSKYSALENVDRGGQTYRFPAAGQLPWFCAYEGSVTDYLRSDEAAVWSEKIIPLCRLNQESAAVILTDNIESMYSFNTGDTSLLSGRFFTDGEYADGSDVCIVSAAYAEANGLNLGDALRLDCYDSGFMTYNNGATSNSVFASGDPGLYRQRYCMFPDEAIGVCKEYTVVGIYTGARFAFGAYQCNADTIIVPKASVPNAENYESPANSLLNTFILENGSAEAFEAYMEQQGLGGQFLYFDQDFSSMEESLAALEANALRLMAVGVGVFLLASALFLFLSFCRMKPTLRGARLLGRPSKAVFGEVLAVLLPSELISVAIGTGIAVILFDTVTKSILSDVLALRSEAMLTAAAAAFVFLAVFSTIGTAVFAARRLMKSK